MRALTALAAFLAVLALASSADAFCFYNPNAFAITVFDTGRAGILTPQVSPGNIETQVCSCDNAIGAGNAFYAVIQPGAKACWYQGGTGSFCDPQVFVVAPASDFFEDNAWCSQSYNARQFSFLSGDGVVLDLSAGTAALYRNSACGVGNEVVALDQIDTQFILDNGPQGGTCGNDTEY
ncbi:hypothetical protein DFJ74DRAFT_673676 [Hyaloraphidium curvatum]|nr:hypothetical protein DFJ74DRAFT_673676 [Hyaloraphidium curvatum]